MKPITPLVQLKEEDLCNKQAVDNQIMQRGQQDIALDQLIGLEMKLI